MKAENLHSLERAERMMARWMCGVSSKDRRHSVDLYSLLGVQSVADVVRCGGLRWFGHLEREGVYDWVFTRSACRNVVVAGVRFIAHVGRGRKTLGECVKDDMKLFELQTESEWAIFRDMQRDFIHGEIV